MPPRRRAVARSRRTVPVNTRNGKMAVQRRPNRVAVSRPVRASRKPIARQTQQKQKSKSKPVTATKPQAPKPKISGGPITQDILLKRASVDSTTVDFVLRIVVKGKGLDGRILIPYNYPETVLKTKLVSDADHRPEGFGYISVSFRAFTAEQMRRDFCLQQPHFPWNSVDDKDELEFGKLNSFYIYSQDQENKLLTTETEKEAFKGLGKLMLCQTLQYGYKIGLFKNIRNAYVIAEADGGVATPASLAKLSTLTLDQLLLTLVKEYPTEAARYITERRKTPLSDQEQTGYLIQLIASCEANSQLIEYYKREYGFVLAQRGYSMGALLAAPALTILSHCKKTS